MPASVTPIASATTTAAGRHRLDGGAGGDRRGPDLRRGEVLARRHEAQREGAPDQAALARPQRRRVPRIQTLRRPFFSRIVVMLPVVILDKGVPEVFRKRGRGRGHGVSVSLQFRGRAENRRGPADTTRERKRPHFVRDDNFVGIGAVRYAEAVVIAGGVTPALERSEGPLYLPHATPCLPSRPSGVPVPW